MNKYRFLFIILLIPYCLQAQESKVFDSLIHKSKILNKDKKFALYLPPGYESTKRSYPVLYLLHGGNGNQTDWIKEGNMQIIVDEAIKVGKAEPMIIIMPDAEATYYMNNVKGKYQFEDYFMKELIPYIEQQYRCRPEKKYRALAGLSMGGFGSLLYAVHYPEHFSACAAMSAAVRTDEQIKELPPDEYARRYRTAMGENTNVDQRITDFWNKNSILYLVNYIPEEQKKAVRIYLDCGDDDRLYKGNALLHIALRDLSIPHEYRVRNGGHEWQYWRTGLPDALHFISESFK